MADTRSEPCSFSWRQIYQASITGISNSNQKKPLLANSIPLNHSITLLLYKMNSPIHGIFVIRIQRLHLSKFHQISKQKDFLQLLHTSRWNCYRTKRGKNLVRSLFQCIYL